MAAYAQEVDTTPPSAIANLSVSSKTHNSVTLAWTVPGDDGNVGRASRYDIRFSTSQIASDADFNAANNVMIEPFPALPGTIQSAIVSSGLAQEEQSITVVRLNQNKTYFFAIKTADEVPNFSPLSNMVSTKTLSFSGAPAIPHAFYGNVTADRNAAGAGTVLISQAANGAERGYSITTQAGSYGGAADWSSKLVANEVTGKNQIIFWAYEPATDSVLASAQTASFENGGVTALNLSFVNAIADISPPVITIVGRNPAYVAKGTAYTDAGASAPDNVDGDLTSSIAATNNVNTAVAGIYNVTYSVADTAGNIARAARTVIVMPVLRAASPQTNSNNGFPLWYEDDNSVKLELCLKQNGLCVLPKEFDLSRTSPPTPIGLVGYGAFPDELYYWIAEAEAPVGNGNDTAKLTLALAAGFDNNAAVNGNQKTSLIVSLKQMSGLQPNSAYNVTHPFGQFNVTTDSNGKTIPAASNAAYKSSDGCSVAPGTPCAFSDLLSAGTTMIGIFLKWYPLIAPLAPSGYLGNPSVPHAITGSPLGQSRNKLVIEGPNIGGEGVNRIEQELFRISGKILSNNTAPAISAIAAQTVARGEVLSFNTTATDADGDVLSYSLSANAPADAYINTSTGAFSWTPTVRGGLHSFEILASDGISTTASPVTVKVLFTPETSDDYSAKNNVWQKDNQTITLTQDCGLWGCNWTRYCFGSACSPSIGNNYAAPLTISAEGATYLRYSSQGNDGTIKPTTTLTIKIDRQSHTNNSIELKKGKTTLMRNDDNTIELEINPTSNQTIALSMRKVATAENTNTVGIPALGKYVEISAPVLEGKMNATRIKIHYTDAEVSAAGLDESTLRLHYYNATSGTWAKYDGNDGVAPDGGVDIINNYVWARTDHFSTWGIFGTTPPAPSPPPSSGGGGGRGGGGGGGRIALQENEPLPPEQPPAEQQKKAPETAEDKETQQNASGTESAPKASGRGLGGITGAVVAGPGSANPKIGAAIILALVAVGLLATAIRKRLRKKRVYGEFY